MQPGERVEIRAEGAKARGYYLFGFGNSENAQIVRGFKGKLRDALKFAESEARRMSFTSVVLI